MPTMMIGSRCVRGDVATVNASNSTAQRLPPGKRRDQRQKCPGKATSASSRQASLRHETASTPVKGRCKARDSPSVVPVLA